MNKSFYTNDNYIYKIMKKYIISLIAISLSSFTLKAQKYITKEGTIDIFSETSLFTIEAKNQKVASILDASNGEIVASTLVRSFKFKEALVEEHFNENYMESNLYPKAQFKGKISNFKDINLAKDGSFDITIEGELSLHGVNLPIITKGKLTVSGDKISGSTEFMVSLEKYKIRVEESYKDRIKDEIKLTVNFNYSKME
jgi:hypothetical protein